MLLPAVVDRLLLVHFVFKVGIGLPNPPLITSTAVSVCVSECEWEVEQGRASAEMTNLRLFEGTSSTCLMLQECPPLSIPIKASVPRGSWFGRLNELYWNSPFY